MPPVLVTLIGKPDCHLCDVAMGVVTGVLEELDSSAAPTVTLEKLSILDDESLYEKYWEQIPVLLVNGSELSHWHVDADALRSAILAG